MQSNNKTLVIVDLDGTLYSINTFEAWILFYLKDSVKAGRWRVAGSLIWFGVLRKLRLISHEMLKRKVIALSADIDKKILNGFVDHLQQYRNKSVVDAFLSIFADFLVLATAAPDFYASELVKDLGFDRCITTRSELSNQWCECRGQEKLRRTAEAIELRQFKQIIFFTDHDEDLPLMRESTLVMLVKPKKNTLHKILNESFEYQIFN